jgi:hypothetical protein
MTFTAGSILKSGSTNTDTLLLAANDTTFITLTTGATDVCTVDAITMKGTWLASGAIVLPSLTLTTPTIASFTNAAHDHSDAAGGAAFDVTGLTNRTRTIFYPVDTGTIVTGAAGVLGYKPVALLDAAATETCYVRFKVPDDFVSFTRIDYVYAYEGGTTGAIRFNPGADYNASAEDWNATTEDPADFTTSDPSDTNRIIVVDSTQAMSGLATGDYVGVRIERVGAHAGDTYTADIRVFGIDFVYTANH